MDNFLRQSLGLESADIVVSSAVIITDADPSDISDVVEDIEEIEFSAKVIAESSAQLDRVMDSTTSLESIYNTLNYQVTNGVVNEQSHQMAYCSLESIAIAYGIESSLLVTSLEDGNDDAKDASNSMLSKIKSMLAQTKGAALSLISKIAGVIDDVRKSIASVAVRVKAKAQKLKSSINSSNSGGKDIKVGGLSSLQGIAKNGVVDGKSFNSALKQSTVLVNSVTSAYNRNDILKNMVDAFDGGKDGTMSLKQVKEFSKTLRQIANRKIDSVENYDQYVSEPLIDGTKILVKVPNENEIKSLFAKAKERATMLYNKMKKGEPYPGKVSTEANPLEGKKWWQNFLLILLYGLMAYASVKILAIIVAKITIIELLCLAGLGATVNEIYEWFKGNGNISFGKESVNSTVSMEAISSEELAELAIAVGTEYKLIGKTDKNKDLVVKSMSAKEIEMTCNEVMTYCDSVIEFTSKTKERKAILAQYVSHVKKVAKGDPDRGQDSKTLKSISNYIKKTINFELDYAKSLSSSMKTALVYANASNKA